MTVLKFWDVVLLVVITCQATLLAYLPARWKALILALPIPFTLAALSVGVPVNATHVAGLVVLLAYTHCVRLLHDNAGVPILPSIAVAAIGYVLTGVLLRSLIPETDEAFWVACAVTLAVAIATHALFRGSKGSDQRSLLSPWIKLPLVATLVFGLILIKHLLGGFMTMFPMIGIFASYEGRTNLPAVCRTITYFMFASVPMLIVIRLMQPHFGVGIAMFFGWLVFIPMLYPLIRDFWGIQDR